MNKLKLLSVGVLISGALSAQNYTIAKWYNDYEAAMVQTYDDMNSDHVNICLPQLKERGMGGTMFVDYDQTSHVTLSGGWPGIMDAVEDGMEMANHTQTHANCDGLSQSGLETEITVFRDFLNSNITNQDCNTFAYPYGAGNRNSTVTDEIAKKHIAARCAGLPGIGPWGYTQNWIYDFGASESDYYQIPTIAEHFLKPNIQKEVDNLLQYGGLMTTMWHAVTAPDHAQFLDNILAACGGKVWHPNFQDAVKYHRERRVSTLSTKTEGYASWVLNLTDTLDDVIFDHPLTIHLDYDDREIVSVKQAGVDLDYTLENGQVNFNAVPDAGDIVIEKKLYVGIKQFEPALISSVYPNPANEVLTVNLSDFSGVQVQLLDGIGRVVLSYNQNQPIKVVDVSHIASGSYILTVNNKYGKVDQERVVLK